MGTEATVENLNIEAFPYMGGVVKNTRKVFPIMKIITVTGKGVTVHIPSKEQRLHGKKVRLYGSSKIYYSAGYHSYVTETENMITLDGREIP